jgi:predicted nucleic acid-binding protein
VSEQDAPRVRVVVTDTNILINLIHVGLLDLLGKLPPYSFVIPEEVVREVQDPHQANAIEGAVASSLLEVLRLTDPAELTVYAELLPILGVGEAACLSLAQCRDWLIASDEKKKFRREMNSRLGPGPHGKTQPAFGRIFFTEGKSLVFYAYDLNDSKMQKANYQYGVWAKKEGGDKQVQRLGIFYSDDKAQRRWVFKCNDPRFSRKLIRCS